MNSTMLRVQPNRYDYAADQLSGLPLSDNSVFILSPHQGDEEDLEPVIKYSYAREKATPYSYSVYLDQESISVNFGVAHQSAMYEFSFEKGDNIYILLNSVNGVLNWNGNSVSGFGLIGNDTHAYIHMEPEESPQNVSVLSGNKLVNETHAEGENACLVLMYQGSTKNIRLRYGISYIDKDHAGKNMEKEVSGKDIEILQAAARDIWNKALGKIRVQGGTEDDKVVFYTAMYRCYYRPVCISEDGRYYSPFDNKVHEDNGRPLYTNDGFWGGYQAYHPLRIFLDPQMEEDILNSYIMMAEQSENFWMPSSPRITGERRSMDGNHGVISVLDAYRKGLNRFDLEKALSGLQKSDNGKRTCAMGKGTKRRTWKVLLGARIYACLKIWGKRNCP